MADVKISNLPAAGSVTPADNLIINQKQGDGTFITSKVPALNLPIATTYCADLTPITLATGCYYIDTNTVGRPLTTQPGYVWHQSNATRNDGVQIYISTNSSVLYIRRASGGVWSAWVDMVTGDTVSISAKNRKITNLNNATLATDAMSYGQIRGGVFKGDYVSGGVTVNFGTPFAAESKPTVVLTMSEGYSGTTCQLTEEPTNTGFKVRLFTPQTAGDVIEWPTGSTAGIHYMAIIGLK